MTEGKVRQARVQAKMPNGESETTEAQAKRAKVQARVSMGHQNQKEVC